jgi:hypothetical protein
MVGAQGERGVSSASVSVEAPAILLPFSNRLSDILVITDQNALPLFHAPFTRSTSKGGRDSICIIAQLNTLLGACILTRAFLSVQRCIQTTFVVCVNVAGSSFGMLSRA